MRSALAFLCLLLVAASSPPQQQRTQQQANPAQDVSASLNRIAGALERSDEPANYSAPCDQGGNRRDSDLCAQWKAADAASYSADWAARSFTFLIIGTVIGALTLGAAAAAAIFAKKAADHTKTGANAAQEAVTETRRIGEAQVRAYLQIVGGSLKLVPASRGMTDQRVRPIVSVRVKNHGQSPARWVQFCFNVRYYPPMHNLFRGNTDFAPDSWGRDVGVGETETFTVNLGDAALTDDDMRSLATAEFHIDVAARFTFKDVFDRAIEDERILTTFVPANGISREVELVSCPLDRKTIEEVARANHPDELRRLAEATGRRRSSNEEASA